MTDHAQPLTRYALWALLVFVIGFFLIDTLPYLPERELRPGETWLNRLFWFNAHAALALPLLVLGPLQFSGRLRRNFPKVHRVAGRTYLILSLVTAVMAFWLGLTIDGEGRQIPLALFAIVWFGFSIAAWKAAVRRDFATHRAFVIRGFAVALAFVWIRGITLFYDELFFFIASDNVRSVSSEWLSFVVPILVVEAWLVWWPSMKLAKAVRPRQSA